MSRFKHDDQAEVALPEPQRRKYEDVRYFDCEVSFAQVIEASHYRTTLGERMTDLIQNPWTRYDDLDRDTRSSIDQYMGSGEFDSDEQMAAHKRRYQYQVEQVPVEEFKHRVMQHGDEHQDWGDDWEAYHHWYTTSAPGGTPDHGQSRWPGIENHMPNEGYLEDGWHRSHSYVKAGDSHIPVVRLRGVPEQKLEATLADDRIFGLGLEGVDADCEHIVVTDRFGYGRCQTCDGHLWCAAWVADGLYGLAEPDGTLDYANTTAKIFAERLPRLVLIGGAK